ncbi:MAG: inositol monophosphatase family protein [Alphaproteobacteria bacterium]
MSSATALMNVMMSAARKAARGLKRDFGEVEQLQVSRKGPADFVTAADLRAERILREELSRARPGYGFLMEETGEITGTDRTHRWLVDPLDGTLNFMHGLPHFAISIALERDGQLVAGLIYDPVKEETFTAEKGRGAFMNDRRIRVSARRDLTTCLLATGIPFPGRAEHARFLMELETAMSSAAGVRRFGAAALDLAYVAAGRYDGFWERGLSPWDIAAGIVLIREAGGFVQDLDGGGSMLTSGSILAGNLSLQPALTGLIRKSGMAKKAP